MSIQRPWIASKQLPISGTELDWDSQSLYTAAILENTEHPRGGRVKIRTVMESV